MKARTLHISGIPVEDRTGIGLVGYLENLLSESSIGGKVLAIQIVPPFADIFNIEVKIRDLKDLNMLMINEDSQSFFCITNKYKNLASFEQTREAYEEELVLETMKPFTSCGHAFVCLDSIYSVDECLTRFKTKPTAYFTYIKQLCASVLSSVKNPLTARDRNLSTFIKMDEL